MDANATHVVKYGHGYLHRTIGGIGITSLEHAICRVSLDEAQWLARQTDWNDERKPTVMTVEDALAAGAPTMRRPHRSTALQYIRAEWGDGKNPLVPSMRKARAALAEQCERWRRDRGGDPAFPEASRNIRQRQARKYYRATMYADRLIRALGRINGHG